MNLVPDFLPLVRDRLLRVGTSSKWKMFCWLRAAGYFPVYDSLTRIFNTLVATGVAEQIGSHHAFQFRALQPEEAK